MSIDCQWMAFVNMLIASATTKPMREFMTRSPYFSDVGGLPPQTQTLSSKAVFKTAYAVIPKGVMSDIVTSLLPHWEASRAWIISRPLSGFAETFAQYIMEVGPGGGSVRPEPDSRAQAAIFVVEGEGTITFDGADHALRPGSFAYLPAGANWSFRNDSDANIRFHWVRKAFKPVEGLEPPPAVFTHEDDVPITMMPDTDGKWGTTRFLDPADIRYDFHLNIVSFEPGGIIPFMETHIMEHGLYVLEGQAVYRLNEDWVEVEAGDYMWLRAYCPQACYAGGPGRFRYLLYKDVNRHPELRY
jgi:(S)-ureidoglycine aminohydrolase